MKRKLQIFLAGLVIALAITLCLVSIPFINFYSSAFQERFYFLGWPLVSAFIAFLLVRKKFPRLALGFAMSGMLPGLTALFYPGVLIVREIMENDHPHYDQLAVGVLVIAVMIAVPSMACRYAFKTLTK